MLYLTSELHFWDVSYLPSKKVPILFGIICSIFGPLWVDSRVNKMTMISKNNSAAQNDLSQMLRTTQGNV